MPTYEYRCNTCGHRFDYFQSISSDALTHCPEAECAHIEGAKRGKGEVQRLVSGGAGIVFKGEGFYLTDYARKGGEAGDSSAEGTKSEKSASEGSTDKKSSEKSSSSAGKESSAESSKSKGSASGSDTA